MSRDYEISLFGIDLKVKTIAFQEQDRVVSACATSALWSMYHAHSDFPLKNIPSASSITKSAVEKYGIDMSDGLNSEMIIQQIKVNKLKPACISLEKDKNFVELKVIIKILIDSGLPLILGVEVFNENSDEKKGKHALTVLGYEEKDNEIVAIFVHDDRYGPYARMNFDNNKLKVLLNNEPVSETETYKPLMLIYAFYPKVHIPVKFLEDTRDSLLDDLKSFYSKDNIPDKNNFKFFNETTELLSKEMKWSIRLVNIKELRHLLFTINPENERVSYLVQGYPKYVWIIEGCYEENIIYFLFDATDIIQGNNFISIIYNSEETKNIFDDYFAYYFSSYLFNRTSKETLFHLPKNAIGEIAKKFKSKNSYDDFLDETFGICHFPNKIKDSEIKDSDLINSLTLRTVYEKTDYFKMDEKIYESSNKKYIWVIDKEGFFCCTLENISGIGHPTLTNGEPGRIGGEIFCKGGVWHINPFSGRYSKEYTPEEKNKFVMNVIKYRLNNIFPDINFEQEKA